jgi:RNA polymerase-binding transcription factor DksA
MKERLTREQTDTLRATLRARLATLRDSLGEHLRKSDDDRARLLADRVRDEEDESVADLIVDLDLAEIDHDIDELRDVEAALERIREGAYGVCATCQGAIPYERLTAYPTAKRCIRCQTVHEKTYAHKGTPTL